MIEVSHLTRYYGDFAALQDVSFTVKEGEVVGLLGLNGAGKSTTLKCLCGLIAPSSGSVRIDGTDVVQAPDALRSRIGYLPESPPLYTDMTVAQFVGHIGRIKGMSASAVKARLPEVLQTCRIDDRANQVIDTLSHGYRKRVGIAQTIIHNPKLVILDEPISGLDPAQIVEMRQVVRNLGQGRAVLISSHHLFEVSQTCDKILVLRDGRLIAQGTESELARRVDAGRVFVAVRGDKDAFLAFLAKCEFVEKHVAAPDRAGFASAIVDLKGDAREDLVSSLVKAGFGVRIVEDPDDELEEIFLALMESGAKA